jgi:RNA-directed DNA polymerase
MMVAQNVFMFIDETGIDEESDILAIACIITKEPSHLRRRLEALKTELQKQRFFRDIPSIKNLEKKGFHYCEDHQDVQPKVIELISELPLDAYIYYKRKQEDFVPSRNFDWYDQLFGKLLYDRLQKHKLSPICIYFEQHGSSFSDRERKLRGIVERLASDIKLKTGGVIQFLPTISSAGKEESCLAAADYIAAVFRDYERLWTERVSMGKPVSSGSWQSRHFAMLRPKIRVIHNLSTDEFFTRHNPFP